MLAGKAGRKLEIRNGIPNPAVRGPCVPGKGPAHHRAFEKLGGYATNQKISFNPSCMSRLSLVVAVIKPALPLRVLFELNRLLLGLAKFA